MNAVDEINLAPAAPSAGRPRSEDCRQKTLCAAETLLARDGYAKMSVEAIANEAGTSKATIYRWWPNKAAIVMEALLKSTEAEVYVPVSQNPLEDVAAKISRAIALFRGPKGRILASLIGGAQFDPELAEAYRKNLLEPRRAVLRAALERAIAAGALRPDINLTLALDMIYGPIYTRLLLNHAKLDDEFAAIYPQIAVNSLRHYGAPLAGEI